MHSHSILLSLSSHQRDVKHSKQWVWVEQVKGMHIVVEYFVFLRPPALVNAKRSGKYVRSAVLSLCSFGAKQVR